MSISAAMLLLLLGVSLAGADDINVTPKDSVTAQTLYLHECARCHGPAGQGNGPDAAHLRVALHSFGDCGWMSMMSDATLFLLIKNGAAAAGFPPGMPAYNGELDDRQIQSLVQYVQGFCRANQ